MQEPKRNHAYTSIPITWLPKRQLEAKTMPAQAKFWLKAWQQVTVRGVIPSKPKPSRQAGMFLLWTADSFRPEATPAGCFICFSAAERMRSASLSEIVLL